MVVRDEGRGGTWFYEAVRSVADTAALFDDAARLESDTFSRRYGIEPEHVVEGNDYFRRVGRTAAQWN